MKAPAELYRETATEPGPFDELDTVTVLMPMPFRGGLLDRRAHARNVDYLLGNCFLDEGRRRVVGIGGTSLIHHLDRSTLLGTGSLDRPPVGRRSAFHGGGHSDTSVRRQAIHPGLPEPGETSGLLSAHAHSRSVQPRGR